MTMRFAKGHGTANDFVILPDTDDQVALTPELVRRLCDRHTGIGADGVLRIVAGAHDVRDGPSWFMDYRNADGAVAEMCGNGIRVFARYLVQRGLTDGPEVEIGTRAGVRIVRCEDDGLFSVDMGPVAITGKGSAQIGGRRYEGLAISVGNPHLVCVVDGAVADLDLSRRPGIDTAEFPSGVNVEVVRLVSDHLIEMRVHERGSGETLSCGTGAVAAAVAAAEATGSWQGRGADQWQVQVPGGKLTVTLDAGRGVLTGPAVIVAEGEIEPGWLAH